MHTALLYKQYLTSQFPDYVALLLLSVHSEGKLAQSHLIRAPREQAAELRELGKEGSGRRPEATSKFQARPAAGRDLAVWERARTPGVGTRPRSPQPPGRAVLWWWTLRLRPVFTNMGNQTRAFPTEEPR